MKLSTKAVLTLNDGTAITVGSGEGGTFESPVDRGDGIGSYDLPFGDGVAFKSLLPHWHQGGRGQVNSIESLRVYGGPHIPWRGSQPAIGEDGTFVIPSAKSNPTHLEPSPHVPESYNSHVLAGGHILPVFFTGQGFHEPTDSSRKAALTFLESITSLELLDDHPLLAHLCGLFERKGGDVRVMGGGRDQGWLQDHWHVRIGGSPREGFKHWAMPKWGDGFDNGHYDGILWPIVNWLRSGHDRDWYFALGQAIFHCCLGRNNVPGTKHYGGQQYEKGIAFPGDYFGESWAKQWPLGMILMWLLTGRHPFFQPFIDAWVDYCRRTSPPYAGAWGARIGANHARNITMAWMLTRDGAIRDRIEETVNTYLGFVDPTRKIWRNHSNGAYPASPWMNLQLTDALEGAMRAIGYTTRLDEVFEVIRSVFRRGIYSISGKPAMRYRIDPPQPAGNIVLTAFSIPSLRIMANYHGDEKIVGGDFDGKTWKEMLRLTEDFVYTFSGSNWGDVAQGVPRQPVEIGYEFAPQGSGGWPKALKFPLYSALFQI